MSSSIVTALGIVLTLSAGDAGSGPAPDGAAPRPGASVDTTVSVRPDQTVRVSNFRGRLEVETWARNAVRIRSGAGGRLPVEVDDEDGSVGLRGATRHGGPPGGSVRLTVPAEVTLEIRGGHLDSRVEGTRGRLRISSLHGSIELDGVSGDVEAATVHGVVEARRVSGTVRLRSVDDDVRVVGARGRLILDSVDGDVVAEDVDATSVSATSVDGDLEFRGRLSDGGEYTLTTHDGDLTVTLAEPVDARVTVSTFDGTFRSDFPVTVERFRGGREMRFTLGDGGAALELSAFDGDIRLRRAR